MKPNIYDYVLSLFTARDEMRPAFAYPFSQEEVYCATDSHSLIVLEKKLTGLCYNGHEKAPDAYNLFKKHNSDTEFTISAEEMLSAFFTAEMKFLHTMKKCEKCDGKGYKECQCCGHESDCSDCDGTGEDFEQIPFGKPFLSGELIQFAGTTFYPNSLNKVIQTAFYLGEKTITVKFEKDQPYRSRVFLIGSAKLLVMPTIKN